MRFRRQVARIRRRGTLRHQRTLVDASGHQRTPDGTPTVTEVTSHHRPEDQDTVVYAADVGTEVRV